jgi:putative tricarboxylic transport membrane protein
MKYGEIISCFLWIGVGTFFCIGAINYGIFEQGVPGPGLLPFMAGAIVITLGIIVLIFDSSKIGGELFNQKDSWKRVSYAVISLIMFAFLLGNFGFVPAAILFVAMLLKLIEKQAWKTVFWFSLVMTSSFYVLFKILLRIPLPAGIFNS